MICRMNRNAEMIRSRLTTREAAEQYGFHVNRNGCIQCPFHVGDRQASLHIYPGKGGWHCFGCGKGGSVIDFAMCLFGCSFSEAVKRLNNDFSLGLQLGMQSTLRERRASQSVFLARRQRMERLRAAQDACDKMDCLYTLVDAFKREYPPESMESILPGYIWAVQNIDQLKYDLLLAEERRWELERSP